MEENEVLDTQVMRALTSDNIRGIVKYANELGIKKKDIVSFFSVQIMCLFSTKIAVLLIYYR